MKELLTDIERWRSAGQAGGAGPGRRLEGSGPRLPGAAMVVSDAGEVAGSVSGGCVEGAVVTEALDVLAGDGRPRLCTFGYSDDEAFAVGLTCGGHHPGLRGAARLVTGLLRRPGRGPPRRAARRPGGDHRGPGRAARAASCSCSPGRRSRCSARVGDPDLDRVVARDAQGELAAGLTVTRHYGRHGEARGRDVSVFIESFAPPPQMIIFGAVDFTAALAKVAKILGYRVTVCDARPVFATRARFPMADEVVVAWPDKYLAEVGSRPRARGTRCAC